jgi:hypothetical protein
VSGVIRTAVVRFGVAGAFLLAVAPAVRAHHSVALVDMSRLVTIRGTVQKFEWTNPHVWVWVEVPGDTGPAVWGVEAAAVGNMTRRGWTRHSLQPGDKITVELHPMRDGRTGGGLNRVILANGQVLGTSTTGLSEPARPAAPVP